MEKRGHAILITASEKDISYRLLDAYGFSYVKLGNYGNSILKKIVNLPLLDFRMYQAVKKFNPDLFLGFGSIRAAHVSRLLRNPCIALDDTEHAVFEHLLYVPFTDVIITPACFRKDFGKKHIRYQGYTELAYLHPDYFVPDPTVLKKIGCSPDDILILLRFVSWQAGHDIGQSGIRNRMGFIQELQKFGRVLISSEGQLEKDLEPLRLTLPPEQLHHLLYYATLYIGEGATIASECAMLGTHALYVNTLGCGIQQDLEQRYCLVYNFNDRETMETSCLAKAVEMLKKQSIRYEGKIKQERLIHENISLTRFLVDFIEGYPRFTSKN